MKNPFALTGSVRTFSPSRPCHPIPDPHFCKPVRVVVAQQELTECDFTVKLCSMYADIECVGAAESGAALLEGFSNWQPDVILLDVHLGDFSGIECIRLLKSTRPAVEFIFFTGCTQMIFDAFLAGANGYLLKNTVPERLIAAIREVYRGGTAVSPEIARIMADFFRKQQSVTDEADKLTRQERVVLDALSRGLSYKEIAAERFVSENTIKSQAYSIYRKLGVNTRTQALNLVRAFTARIHTKV